MSAQIPQNESRLARQGGLQLRGRFVPLVVLLAILGCRAKDDGPAASPAEVLPGMGSVHHRIVTANPNAQRFFDQGLALVYAFNFGEAIISFRRAAELDPNSPMPYWGIALALRPNYNSSKVGPDREQEGFDAIQTAVGLARGASEPERAYIDALACDFSDDPEADLTKLNHEYANAMREVYHRYPDDSDAAVLFVASLMNMNAWHLWKIDGQPGPDTLELVAVLEDALRRWPEHTGANHLYIHAMEASPYPERALPSAHRLPALAPAAGHLVHMASHIYFRTGDFAAAVKSNQDGVEADQRYQRTHRVAPSGVLGYANHNLHFLAVAATMDGEYETARDAAKRLLDGHSHSENGHLHSGASLVLPMLVRMRFAHWDEIIALPAPDPQFDGLVAFWHFARGCALASRHRLKEAEDERRATEQAFSRLTPGRAFGMYFNDWSTLQSLAADTLAARIAAANGNSGVELSRWRAAVATQDQMNFDDLPDWYYPVRESLGAALLRAGQPQDAENVFREDLRRTPRNPRSLFGLCKALQVEKRDYEAGLVRQAFDRAWKGKGPPRIEDF